jgi:uncharacterized membrane protein
MPQLARQEIAELFLVLLILLMVDKNMNKTKRSFLFIIFGISLVVSHYGLSYIYMFCLISAWLLLVLMDSPAIQRLTDNFFTKFSRYKSEKLTGNPNSTNVEDRTISSTFVLLFITFTLTWYMYVSSSSAFNTIVNIGDHIASSIYADFLNPKATEGLRMVLAQPAPGLLHEVNRVINYLNQIFIIIGCITLLLIYRELKFEREYAVFSMVNLAILFAAVSVPFFASSLAMTRVYHITLIFLAPFCVIGGITVFRALSKVARLAWTNKSVRISLKVLSAYLVIVMLYSTGFVWEVAEGQSGSISLNSTMDYPRFNNQEVLGAEWLNDVKSSNFIYADEYRRLLIGSFDWEQVRTLTFDIDKIQDDSYIYFGSLTIEKKEIMLVDVKSARRITSKYINSSQIVEDRNKIYTNGGAQVYY